MTHNHTYQQVELNPGVPGEIENMLDKLHKALHEVCCRAISSEKPILLSVFDLSVLLFLSILYTINT